MIEGTIDILLVEDTLKAYNLGCNCYITKPINFDQFIKVVQSIEEFWFTIVKLPRKQEKF